MENRKNKIKLLIVEPVSDMGGVSQYILAIVRYLPKDKFDIYFGASGNGDFISVLKKEGLKTYDLLIDYSMFSFLPAILMLRKFLKKENFDIIHAHTAKAGLLCSLANLGLAGKIVYNGHGFRFSQDIPIIKKILSFCLEWIICRFAKLIILITESEYNTGIKNGLIFKDKARIVPMTIDVNKFLDENIKEPHSQIKILGIPNDAFVVGMVGRITFQKDPETFIKIAEILKVNIEKVYFVWVGDGDMKNELISMAKKANIWDRLILTGQKRSEEIPAILNIMNVFLFTSRFEELPSSILEAMAAKKFIVSADVGSISDVIKVDKTGWKFQSGDYNKAALIIEDIYNNKGRYKRIKENAFDLVIKKFFPKENISKEFQNIYQSLI